MLKAHVQYLRYVFLHKWFVFLECCKLGIPWLGIIHDLSKFRPDEWFPYVHYFYNPDGSPTGDAAFDFAWLLHQKRNKHHWQWWILSEDEGGFKILPMPDRYCHEMLADWRGAGRAQGNSDTRAWYLENEDKIRLHSDTRRWIEKELMVQGGVDEAG